MATRIWVKFKWGLERSVVKKPSIIDSYWIVNEWWKNENAKGKRSRIKAIIRKGKRINE
jgi:hypothetical protein